MKRVKIDPSFINSFTATVIERERGLQAIRALYGILDIIAERAKNTDNCVNRFVRDSVTADVFLDELKFKTKMMHQNKLEDFLNYLKEHKIIGYIKDERTGQYNLYVDKETMFFEMD